MRTKKRCFFNSPRRCGCHSCNVWYHLATTVTHVRTCYIFFFNY